MSATLESSTRSVGERLRQAFDDLNSGGLEALPPIAALYHEELEFEDPVQKFVGRDRFIDLLSRMHTGGADVSFVIGDVCEGEDLLFSSWSVHIPMKYTPDIRFDGVSHCRVVVSHRDYWDVAGVLLGQLPFVKPIFKRITRFLS